MNADREPSLDEIEAALEAATPGPWGEGDHWVFRDTGLSGPHALVNILDRDAHSTNANARLIARAPEWLAYLCSRVREAEAEHTDLDELPFTWERWQDTYIISDRGSDGKHVANAYEWRLIDALQAAEARVTALETALREVERHCPCGARPESPATHPHVGGCPVGRALAPSQNPEGTETA